MKTAITGAVLTVLSLSLPVVAANVNKSQFKGENVYASFYQYDDCNSVSVYVSAFTSITKSAPGAPTDQMGAYLSYYNYNYCTGAYSSGFGESPNATFTADNQLKSASLKGTFTLYDYYSGTTKTANVNLTWAGTGDLFRNRSSYTYQTPTSISRYRSNGDFRDAEVLGSVTVDGINVITSTSSYGSLNSSKSGSFERITK